MLCPCRKRNQGSKKAPLLRAVASKTPVDYSDIFPSFSSILVSPMATELQSLQKLQALLAQWAYCHTTNQCQFQKGLEWLESENENGWKAWTGPAIQYQNWDPSLQQRANEICFRVKQGRQTKVLKDDTVTLKHGLGDALGWVHHEGPMWNLLWRLEVIHPEPFAHLKWQVSSNYRKTYWIGQKDKLNELMKDCARNLATDPTIENAVPGAFAMPFEIDQFRAAFQANEQAGNPNVWIMKPQAGTLGNGINLLTRPEQAEGLKEYIVQQYVERPLLAGGYKFDIRVYVVTTSFNPLEAFVYHNGMIRMCKTKFTNDFSNRYAHVTNITQQDKTNQPGLFGNGRPGCDHREMEEILAKQGVSWAAFWPKVNDAVLQVLACGEKIIPPSDNTFQLFGFDVLMDDNLRPWVLEVNTRPSIQESLPFDVPKMITAIGRLLNPPAFDRHALATIVERRMGEIYAGVVRSPADEMAQLNQDLYQVLQGRVNRPYGEMPEYMEGFERIAPSPAYAKYRKALDTVVV